MPFLNKDKNKEEHKNNWQTNYRAVPTQDNRAQTLKDLKNKKSGFDPDNNTEDYLDLEYEVNRRHAVAEGIRIIKLQQPSIVLGNIDDSIFPVLTPWYLTEEQKNYDRLLSWDHYWVWRGVDTGKIIKLDIDEYKSKDFIHVIWYFSVKYPVLDAYKNLSLDLNDPLINIYTVAEIRARNLREYTRISKLQSKNMILDPTRVRTMIEDVDRYKKEIEALNNANLRNIHNDQR